MLNRDDLLTFALGSALGALIQAPGPRAPRLAMGEAPHGIAAEDATRYALALVAEAESRGLVAPEPAIRLTLSGLQGELLLNAITLWLATEEGVQAPDAAAMGQLYRQIQEAIGQTDPRVKVSETTARSAAELLNSVASGYAVDTARAAELSYRLGEARP